MAPSQPSHLPYPDSIQSMHAVSLIVHANSCLFSTVLSTCQQLSPVLIVMVVVVVVVAVVAVVVVVVVIAAADLVSSSSSSSSSRSRRRRDSQLESPLNPEPLTPNLPPTSISLLKGRLISGWIRRNVFLVLRGSLVKGGRD